jgi:hypothetical protein
MSNLKTSEMETLLEIFMYDTPKDFVMLYYRLLPKQRKEFRNYLFVWCRQNNQFDVYRDFYEFLLCVNNSD